MEITSNVKEEYFSLAKALVHLQEEVEKAELELLSVTDSILQGTASSKSDSLEDCAFLKHVLGTNTALKKDVKGQKRWDRAAERRCFEDAVLMYFGPSGGEKKKVLRGLQMRYLRSLPPHEVSKAFDTWRSANSKKPWLSSKDGIEALLESALDDEALDNEENLEESPLKRTRLAESDSGAASSGLSLHQGLSSSSSSSSSCSFDSEEEEPAEFDSSCPSDLSGDIGGEPNVEVMYGCASRERSRETRTYNHDSFPKDIQFSFVPNDYLLKKADVDLVESELFSAFRDGYMGRWLTMSKANGPLCLGRGGVKGSFSLGGSEIEFCRPYVLVYEEEGEKKMAANRLCCFPFARMEDILPFIAKLVHGAATRLGFSVPDAKAQEALNVELNFDGQGAHSDGRCVEEILVVILNLDQSKAHEESLLEIHGANKAVFRLGNVQAYRVQGKGVGTFRHARKKLEHPESLGRHLFIVVRKIRADLSPQRYKEWDFREWSERVKAVAMTRNRGIVKDFGMNSYHDVWLKKSPLMTETGLHREPARPCLPSSDVLSVCQLGLFLPMPHSFEAMRADSCLLPRGAEIRGTKNREVLNLVFPMLNLAVASSFTVRVPEEGDHFIAGAVFPADSILHQRKDFDMQDNGEPEGWVEAATLGRNTLIFPSSLLVSVAVENASYILSYAKKGQVPSRGMAFPIFVTGTNPMLSVDYFSFIGQGTVLAVHSCLKDDAKDLLLIKLTE